MSGSVLVTGGAGFIGSHLVDRLIADGHDVTVLDDLSTGSSDNLAAHGRDSKIKFVRGSVLDATLVDREFLAGLNRTVSESATSAGTLAFESTDGMRLLLPEIANDPVDNCVRILFAFRNLSGDSIEISV